MMRTLAQYERGVPVVSELEFVHRTNLKENDGRYVILIIGMIVVVEKRI